MLVEPFNGLAPWRRTLSRQPTEILDVSVLHLESWRDLLSLAQLHAVIFPRHYEYRIVRCNISRIAVWENAGRRTTWTTTKKTPKATMPSNRDSHVYQAREELIENFLQATMLKSAGIQAVGPSLTTSKKLAM
ncbi:hypothetical protein FOMPIDRAFT_82369 [Fomitopsis schrenkii]|uniref:F-box domain-containing protein n=1 Tax=Fomitopsis schrenkii TaxID=2126942 RepID=S8F820_FOMSC|nr:hypothetical protein FOMPIDRAFT_82369 [Fomitopsis schrenkii]